MNETQPQPLRKVSLFEAEKLFLMKATWKNANSAVKLLVSAENYGEAKKLTEDYFNQLEDTSFPSSLTGNEIKYHFGLRIKEEN